MKRKQKKNQSQILQILVQGQSSLNVQAEVYFQHYSDFLTVHLVRNQNRDVLLLLGLGIDTIEWKAAGQLTSHLLSQILESVYWESVSLYIEGFAKLMFSNVKTDCCFSAFVR